MTTFLTVLSLGFLLGLRHTTDADHVVAISTINIPAQIEKLFELFVGIMLVVLGVINI